MAFPVPQIAGGFYHVTQRGHDGAALFREDADRRDFLGLLSLVATRRRWLVLAYCLMGNHVHLIVRTPEPDLSAGMAYLTGLYAQYFNERHHRRGTPFQGRFRGFVIERDGHLEEALRYVVLNPVKARLVKAPEEWLWSSYRATAGLDVRPRWLAVGQALQAFSNDPRIYRNYVMEGIPQRTPNWHDVRRMF